MPTELDDIRAAFEHQISLFGPRVFEERGTAEQKEHVEVIDATIETTDPVEEELAVDDKIEEVESTPAEAAPEVAPEAAPEAALEAATDTSEADVYARIAQLIPGDSPMVGMRTLDEVSAWVASTELIELDATRLNPVFGVGNPEADLMVIGEAPGADEDKKGEPFVGRAGQLLTKILEAIGFPRETVYIANILKSRPPGNRDPLPEEIRAHIPILHKQISLIRPKVILCVGRTSGTSLLGIQSSLKDMRGTFHDYHGIPVMVTYHPAALLRNPNWKRPTWEDVQILRAKYDELTA